MHTDEESTYVLLRTQLAPCWRRCHYQGTPRVTVDQTISTRVRAAFKTESDVKESFS